MKPKLFLRRTSPHKDEVLTLGRPDVKQDTPSHVPGVEQGNAPGHYEKMPGHLPDGRSNSRRSTGVGQRGKNPVLPAMPNLSPP